MKRVSVKELREDVEKYLALAGDEELAITEGSRVVGILVGVESKEDIDDFLIENDPRFLNRIAQARDALEAGEGVPLKDLPE